MVSTRLLCGVFLLVAGLAFFYLATSQAGSDGGMNLTVLNQHGEPFRENASRKEEQRTAIALTGSGEVSRRLEDVAMPRSNQTNVRCNAGDKTLWRPGKCSIDSEWMIPWVRLRPKTNWVLVDVGANKGYVIAGWLETLLGGRTPFTPHNLGVQLYANNSFKSGYNSMCGGCCECIDRPADLADEERASTVRVFGYEPSIANFKWIDAFFNDKKLVKIFNAAVSDKAGLAYFPVNELGFETGKVASAPTEGYVPVQIVTLDGTIPSEVKYLDVLCTDAEGFDQDVARGANRFLPTGQVGVYQFEMYRKENYKEVFSRLANWGYVCYFFTEARRIRRQVRKRSVPTIVRITDCWEDVFNDYIGWVNGLCYNTRNPHLVEVFSALETKMHRGSGGGNCNGRQVQMQVVRKFVATYVEPIVRQRQVGGAVAELPPLETEGNVSTDVD